jgi:dCMP deaminase
MSKVSPRTVPIRDEKYMGLAFWAASFSKDPSTQVGAFIVSADGHPLGWGYNGPPKQVDDDEMDWGRPAKYHMIVHAEANAIDHTLDRSKLEGATIYVTAHPCEQCMLKIANAKIEKVVYFPFAQKKVDKGSSLNDDSKTKAEEVAENCDIELEEFDGDLNWMRDRIKFMKDLGIFD